MISFEAFREQMLKHFKEASLPPEFSKKLRKKIRTIKTQNFFQHVANSGQLKCSDVLDYFQGALSEFYGMPILKKHFLKVTNAYLLSLSFPEIQYFSILPECKPMLDAYVFILDEVLEFERLNPEMFHNFPLFFIEGPFKEKIYNKAEYALFLSVFKSKHVYSLMKLDEELTGHTTLAHISGVHAIAVHIGKQLVSLQMPVDIGLISGAAATHDIGKYGCIGENVKRIPYLHYYFTDQWTKQNQLNYIGHIGTNHSVWDLELENLPIESLVLIYSDFRVKNETLPDGQRKMKIFTLADSFEVILSKLDNVDEEKKKRYERVYMKLKDFEDFMIHHGISTQLEEEGTLFYPTVRYSLLPGPHVVEHLKFQSINHNIHLMGILRTETSLSQLIESARSERNSTTLQSYIQMFREYSAYLTQSQKRITLDFLYDTLIHEDDDIRRQAASVIGLLIATFDEKYRKEIPADVIIEAPAINSGDILNEFLDKFLLPDVNLIETHKKWITHSIRIMLASLYSYSGDEQKKEYRDIFLDYYIKEEIADNDLARFYMLLASKHIPFKNIRDEKIALMYHFVLNMLERKDDILKISALERIYNLLIEGVEEDFRFQVGLYLMKNKEKSSFPAENYMKWKIAKVLGLHDLIPLFEAVVVVERENYSEIYLQNLKSLTHWMIKKIHIRMLKSLALSDPKTHGFYISMHLCNLIKVSEVENVRNHAGDALVEIFPLLTEEQKNDVTVELLRALEIEGFRFTKYIPYYLGQILLYLEFVELDELMDDIVMKLKVSGDRLYYLLLKTISVVIQNYPAYLARTQEEKSQALKRYDVLLGALISGLVHTDEYVRQEAFSIIGKEIFNSSVLTLSDKAYIFGRVAKRILILFADKKENKDIFLNNSHALNHIYRFILSYTAEYPDLEIHESHKVALFPGTFDPFSLSHKKIAEAIRNMGFDVYLYVDEFSWSKRTQPNHLRRKIIRLSIASELGIYVLSEDISINIANDADIESLKSLFPSKEIYLVIGSDVILNASFYQNLESHALQHLNHIVFTRFKNQSEHMNEASLKEKLNLLTGKSILLSLPPQYEEISSSQIRSNIDENRDISQLIDSYAMKYIYEYGLYRREPQFKKMLEMRAYDAVIEPNPSKAQATMIWKQLGDAGEELWINFTQFLNQKDAHFILLKNLEHHGEIIGCCAFHRSALGKIYEEFSDCKVTDFLRKHSCGYILNIDGVFIHPQYHPSKIIQILLTEALSYGLKNEYTHAIFSNLLVQEAYEAHIKRIFNLQGFEEIEDTGILSVSMQRPCTLYLDLKAIIKEPFANDTKIDETINEAREDLQEAITRLYPGNLVLSFDRTMMFNHLINRICDLNHMPSEALHPRQLGPLMCVPFGSILKGYTVPNTVTKSMHTEKMFSEALLDFNINAYPNYLSIENQIKMLKSFNKDIILVDDLLNKGYRINAIAQLLKKENLTVEKIVVGIATGRGIELMRQHGYDVSAIYYLPNLNVWFNESSFYPFIGGDTVNTNEQIGVNLLPSINFILPYATPRFIQNAPKQAVSQMSETALQNALKLMQVMENVYREYTKRPLTLKHVGEVFVYPRYPYKGHKINYDLNAQPSEYLKNDVAHLKRIMGSIQK